MGTCLFSLIIQRGEKLISAKRSSLPGSILMPFRFVVERHDPSVGHFAGKHVLVFQPIDMDLLATCFSRFFPGPCPVRVCSQAMDCDYATTLRYQSNIQKLCLPSNNILKSRISPLPKNHQSQCNI